MTDMKYVLDAFLSHAIPHGHQVPYATYEIVGHCGMILLKTSRINKWTKFVPQRRCVYVYHPHVGSLMAHSGESVEHIVLFYKASHASRRLLRKIKKAKS